MFLIMENISEILLIDDIVKGIYLCAIKGFLKKKGYFKIFNIASGRPIKLTKFIEIIEKLKLKATKIFKTSKGRCCKNVRLN